MHYEVESDRQSCGSCSGETHRVVRVEIFDFCRPASPRSVKRTTVAVFRRRDMAEDLCGEFNAPKSQAARRLVQRELAAA